MSSKLFPYVLRNNQWIKSEEISIDDIAVLVDTQRDIIWYHESEKCTARTKFEARGLLTQLKEKYVPYKFKRIDNTSPQDILYKLEELRKEETALRMEVLGREIQDFSVVLFYLNIAAGLLQVFSVIFLITTLFWPQTFDSQSFLNYSVNINTFTSAIDFLTFLVLISFILFSLTGFLGVSSKRGDILKVSGLLAIILYLSLIYIRIGITPQFLYYTLVMPDLVIRTDAYTWFVIGAEMILITCIIISVGSGVYWLKKTE